MVIRSLRRAAIRSVLWCGAQAGMVVVTIPGGGVLRAAACCAYSAFALTYRPGAGSIGGKAAVPY